MAQPAGPSQAEVAEACLLRLSSEAKEAPYNEAAALAVEFSVTAEKAALGSLQAFCTFLGKVHETGPFSLWPSWEDRGEKCTGCCPLPCEASTKEGNTRTVEECYQLAAVNFELNLMPFSFPATFCEQFIKEALTLTVVRTPESAQDAPQRKDAQPKASAKPDGREKSGKKAGPPRSIIPPGESRIAEMPVAALLLLKDGERMQPPEGVQEALSTIPGVASLRIEVKAVTSLLSPALRHLLNPVWFIIRDARYLPLSPLYLQKPRPNDASEGAADNTGSAAAAAAGEGAAAAVVPIASSSALTAENKGASSENQSWAETSRGGRYSAEGPSEYFARAHLFRTVVETEPRMPTTVLGANRVRWDAGFLCFWGPSVEDQNELKDFIEERRLEVELLNTYDLSGMGQSSLCEDVTAWQCKSKTTERPLLKQPKTASGTPAKARRGTTKTQRSSGGNPETPSNQFLLSSTNTFPTGAEPTPFRPPHGVASFCLSTLSSCGATHLSFCTDILPVAGYVARKEGTEIVQLCRTAGPDFMGSGTQISIEIRLAEPLFQHLSFATLPDRAELSQEGGTISSSVCTSISFPQQGINRLFLVAPLGSKVADEAKQIERKEKEQSQDLLQDNNNSGAAITAAATYEAAADILTGFLIADGRLLYGVLEGQASGRLASAAEQLLAAAREDEGNRSQILYNSHLRFSERRYCVADLLEKHELKVPLREIMLPMGLQGRSNSSSLAFSCLSKLQMATLLSRAADLKCQDLFPTSAELKCIRQLNFQ